MSNPDDPRERFRKPVERPSMNLPARRPEGADEPAAEASAAPGGLARLLQSLARLLAPKPAQPPTEAKPAAAPAAEPPVYTVLVAAMNGDTPGGDASQNLFKALDSRPALKVKPFPRPFQLDSLEDPTLVQGLAANLRHAIANENADLVLWGDVSKDGYVLRLSGTAPLDDERPASFGLTTRIELPLNLGDPQLDLLFGAILAAADPINEVQRAAIRRLLPQAAQVLEAAAARPPVALTMGQQRSIQLVFGHVAVSCAMVGQPSQADPWFQKAADAYRAAEKRVGRNEPLVELGLLQRHLAAAQAARADRVKDKAQAYLEDAVKAWRSAAETINRAAMPLEWASLQTRLGTALYRLDLLTGDVELLREALTCLQAALQVHTRADAPQRWADIMHNIAQVLEVYGDQLKNPEVLSRAVDACHSVLEIRTRERTPLAWAATSNTLGSALFLLDKHGGGVSHLHEAVDVLEQALEVFRAHNAKGPAQVAARNLAHVKKLAEDRKARQVIDPHWADRR